MDTEDVDGVHVVTMRAGDNAFDLSFVRALRTALEAAQRDPAPLVLIGDGTRFSTGLNLEWLGNAPATDVEDFLRTLHDVLAALLTFPGYVVAAVNGHAFGAGAILAAACDERIMRSDRGWFCFPEVDLGLSMSDEFDAVLRSKIDHRALQEALLSGRQYDAERARAAGLVDRTASGDGLLRCAIERAQQFRDKDGQTLGRLRAKLHADALAVLTRDSART